MFIVEGEDQSVPQAFGMPSERFVYSGFFVTQKSLNLIGILVVESHMILCMAGEGYPEAFGVFLVIHPRPH